MKSIIKKVICFVCILLSTMGTNFALELSRFEEMNIANIATPFDVLPEEPHWGWCTANGIISSILVDLDGDGMDERLVIYTTSSVHMADTEYKKAVPELFLHPTGLQDLRLAVFNSTNEKCADIIVQDSMVGTYINVHVSVWGDSEKYIYVRSGIMRYDGVGVDYAVLRLHNGDLVCELLLIDPGYTDRRELFRVDTTDPVALFDSSRYSRVSVYENTIRNVTAFEGYQGLPFGAELESQYSWPNYAISLEKQFVKFNINVFEEENFAACLPVCAIRFYTDYGAYFDMEPEDAKYDYEIIDYTRIVR